MTTPARRFLIVMFILGILSILSSISRQDVAHASTSSLRIGSVQYNQGSYPSQYVSQLAQWLGINFYWVNEGAETNLAPYTSQMWWAQYQDGGGLYPRGVYAWVHDVAQQHGWNSESMFLHFNRDYLIPNNLTWTHLDQFDYWEESGTPLGYGGPTASINGAFVFDGTNYHDVTVSIYQQSCGSNCQISNGKTLYLGYAEPFDLVNLNISTGRASGTAQWQYWKGSTWATLTPTTDTTNGLQTSGQIQFPPPLDWAPNVVNGSQSKYWIRLTITGTQTPPTISKASGDDWVSHSNTCNGASCNERGWDFAACQSGALTMNNGIQYCANPSPNATARFRYQGRATGNWLSDYLFLNPTDFQGGQLTLPALQVARWNSSQQANGNLGFNMTIFDNGDERPQPTYPTWASTQGNDLDVPCNPSSCSQSVWDSYWQALLSAYTATMKAIPGHGSGFKVMINGGSIFEGVADFNFYELGFSAWVSGNINFSTFDAYLPANNPNSTQVGIAAWDNQKFGTSLTVDGSFHLWDMSNRSPMSVLATYDIASNQNTFLTYNTEGWSYFDRDEFYYWSPLTTTLSSALSADTSTSTKTIHLTDGSQFTPPGLPLYSSNYPLQIGGQDVVNGTKVNNTTFTTNTPIVNTYPAGTVVRFAQTGHFACSPACGGIAPPNTSDIWYYANYFPAMSVDIGTPDPNGWMGGARDITYATGTAISNQSYCAPPGQRPACAELWRRDYTNAIILDRVMHNSTLASELELYSKPINLVDPSKKLYGPYYELNAEGTTGPPITSISLRGAEAAILMKSPIAGGGGGGTPSVPTGLAGTATSSTSVSLTWNASTEQGGTIAGYDIYRNSTKVGTSTTASYNDTGLSASTTYTYTVDAYDTNNNHSAHSSPIQVTTPPGGGGTPSVPTGLAGTATSSTSVSLTWNASTEQGGTIAGYDIYRNSTKVGTSTSTSYNDTGLSASTTYTYTVDAYDTNNNHSAQSSPIQVTTLSGNNGGPTIPTNLTGTATSSTSVSLSWTASTENGSATVKVVGYDIFRNGTNIGTSPNTTYADNTVAANTTYTYTVDAFDNATPPRHSSQSTPIQVTTPQSGSGTPTTPTNLTGTATSSTSVSLSWTASTEQGGTGSIAGYEVYRDGTAIGTSTTTTYTDTTVVGSTTYIYTVDAYDTNNNHSPQSTPVSVTTPQGQGQGGSPTTPTNLTGTATSPTSVSLSWQPSTETGGTIAGYDIYRNGVSIGTSTTTTYADTTVSGATTYTYTVDAFDSASPPQHSSQSTPVQITTPQTGSGTPSTPTNLSGTAISSSEIDLTWSPSTESGGTGSIAGYEVYRNGAAIGTSTTTTFVDSTVLASTTYTYTVDAYDTNNNHSQKSSPVSVTTPSGNGGGGSDIRYGSNIAISGTIYFLDHNGFKRPYTNAGDFLSFGFNSFSSVLSPNQDEQNLPIGRFVTPMDGSLINDHGTVYLVSRGTKAGFTSANVFLSFGYKWNNVVVGDVSFMDLGPILDSSSRAHLAGTLVLDHGTVYLLAEDGKMGIPSIPVFNSWGYNFNEVVQANSFDQALPMSSGIMQTRGVTLSPL